MSGLHGWSKLRGCVIAPPKLLEAVRMAKDIHLVAGHLNGDSSQQSGMMQQLRDRFDHRHRQNASHIIHTSVTATADKGHSSVAEMYSDQALLERESIRCDPEIQRILKRMFRLVDVRGRGFIDRHEYTNLNIVLYKCLQSFWDESLEDLTTEQMKQVVAEDWVIDAKGKDTLDKQGFGQAIFQLCDVWTGRSTLRLP
jgi:hypothetical protein